MKVKKFEFPLIFSTRIALTPKIPTVATSFDSLEALVGTVQMESSAEHPTYAELSTYGLVDLAHLARVVDALPDDKMLFLSFKDN